MRWIRQCLRIGIGLLAMLGVYAAAVNAPLRTGCDFYANCAKPPVQTDPAAPVAPAASMPPS